MATTVKDLDEQVAQLRKDMVQWMTEPPPRGQTVQALMVAVMAGVGVVSKDQTNEQFHYSFRGIDDVVNQVQPAMVAAGVSMGSTVVAHQTEMYTTGKGTVMRWALVHMRYTFVGPMGDTQVAEGVGEAADASDKAHMKAMQQAYKYALLQVLAIPTHEPDADADSPEGAAPTDLTDATKAAVLDIAGGDQDRARQLWTHALDQTGHDPKWVMDQAAALAVLAAVQVAAQAPFNGGDGLDATDPNGGDGGAD